MKKELLFIVMFQIFLLVNITSANSYILHQSDSLIENSKIIEEKSMVEKLMNYGINLLIGFLSIKQIGIVSAEEFWCCEETTEGEICRDIPVGDDSLCKEGANVWTDSCESESAKDCNLGTCVDEDKGTCSARSPKLKCTTEGGTWHDDLLEDVQDCNRGCCILEEGTKKHFRTSKHCTNEGGIFKPEVSQEDCVIYSEEMGACVFNENDCKFTTEQDCEINLNGDFSLRLLCSNFELNTNCGMPSKDNVETTCYNNKVYFLDTCGELANVYDSDKLDEEDQNYWDIVQEPICNVEFEEGKEDTIEGCGDCNGINSICVSSSEAGINPDDGDYVCKSLDCIDKNDDNKERKNTEAWCVYESYVGDSRDVVGSEYRVRYCDKGEIKTKLCENYRGQICAEKSIMNEGELFSMAECRPNEGWKCYQIGLENYEYDENGIIVDEDKTEEKNNETCGSISDCRLHSVDLYSAPTLESTKNLFKFDVCVPKYPPGLEFWDSASNAKDVCNSASITCTTIWKQKIKGGAWFCKGNCGCLSKSFANQMNSLCTSFGDCGGYVNVEGEYTKNFKTFDKDEINWLEEGDALDSSEHVEMGSDANGDISSSATYKKYSEQIGQGYPPEFFGSAEGFFEGSSLEDIEGPEGDFLDISRIGAQTFGASLGLLFDPILLIISLIFIILESLTETKEIVIEFKCQPWQAPPGGKDCKECNEDELRPCTEYKCRSLGSTCRILEEVYESENPVCINTHPDDHSAPVIDFVSIEGEYEAHEINNGIKINGSTENCIQESSNINFTLGTKDENGDDEYARCVYNWAPGVDPPTIENDYALIGEEFNEGNFYSTTHTFEGKLPKFSSDYVSNKDEGALGERKGELAMYVRCMDQPGNFNPTEYVVNFCIREGPDKDHANILEFIPKDESFLKYDVNETDLIIYLDEPAKCKFSYDLDKSYDEMTDFLSCEEYYVPGKSRWMCLTKLADLTKLKNEIYIKCKDQPWISEGDYKGPWDETDRNENAQGFLYTLYATENPLEINKDSISPQGEKIGSGAMKISLEATTSGGAYNGVSICKYEFYMESIERTISGFFSSIGSTHHKQSLILPGGDYDILITCEDKVENNATGNAVFNLKIDSSPPNIIRVYKDGGSLKIITDEDARCYYNTDVKRCDFNLEYGTSMTTAFSTSHTISWDAGVTYYIKCRDTFDVENEGCAKKIITST
ncbi:hypothetical protein KAJ87_02740 [Candidatus Pacearchaeota archaeon]|nr:hypothetical protein [Candidatus Pacearchaeota archaeon]